MRSNKSNPEKKPETPAAKTPAPSTQPAGEGQAAGNAPESTPGNRTSRKVEERLNPYIAAHPKDLAYYTKLIAENPERAARTLMLRDLEAFEGTMKRIERQMPYMQAFFDQQSPEVKKRIEAADRKRRCQFGDSGERPFALLDIQLREFSRAA